MTFSIFIQEGNKGKDDRFPISIRIFHNKQNKYIKTIYRVPKSALTRNFDLKDPVLLSECANLIKEYESLMKMEGNKAAGWTAQQVKDFLIKKTNTPKEIPDFVKFFEEEVNVLEIKKSSLDGYKACLNHLIRFSSVTPITDITEDFVDKFQTHLKKQNVGQRGQRLYLTLFKAIYDKARKSYKKKFELVVEDAFIDFQMPKNPIPAKRNIPKEKILDLLNYKSENLLELDYFSRDVFFISFLLCGTNTIDLFYLDKIENGRISYERKKTTDRRDDNALISYKVETELLPYLERYKGKNKVFDFSERYKSHEYFNNAVNNGLHTFRNIKELELPSNFTSYYARHSWATIARNKCRISKDDISLCLNHSTGRNVTDDYIERDFSIIDECNRKVIDYIFQEQ